jgi:hypothetical protein
LAPQGVSVEIGDELIDFSQQGGWAKIDSANIHPVHKLAYPDLLEQLDVLTIGVRVGTGNLSFGFSRRKLKFFISRLETKSRGR